MSTKNKKKRVYPLGYSALAIAMLSASYSAQAQTQAPAAQPAATTEPGDIIVTAQKRSQSAQSVPISMQVTDGEQLVTQNITSLRGLAKISPSVIVQQSGRADKLSIRGVSSGVNASLEQSVGVYEDGIYHGRSRSSAAGFLDLDRVEVLKGPQSIFFGNSSIAGALNVITHAPDRTFNGYVRSLYGENQEYLVEAAMGGPLTNTLRARIAVSADGINGWMNDTGAGYKIPIDDRISGRVSVTWEPTDNFSATFKAEGSHAHSKGGSPSQPVGCPPALPFPQYDPNNPASLKGFCKTMYSIGQEANLDLTRAWNQSARSNMNSQEYVATLNYDVGGLSFTSVTGLSNMDYLASLDLDETPQVLFNLFLPERSRQFSQELRVASPEGQALEYIAGVYYQHNNLVGSSDGSYFFLGAPAPIGPLGQHIGFTEKGSTYSAFAALTWHPTEALKITGGLRYQKVHKDFVQEIYYGLAGNPDGPPTTRFTGADADTAQAYANARNLGVAGVKPFSRSDDKFTPSVNIQYTFPSKVMLYASYANGFKAGGFNGIDITATPSLTIPFGPESVNSYEIGLKSRLFNRRVLFNLALFRSQYSNLQVTSTTLQGAALLNLIKNAASEVSQGIEVETEWAVTDRFKLELSGTYLDAYFKSFTNTGSTPTQQLSGQTTQDVSGKRPTYAPEFSGHGVATYKLPIGSFDLTFQADAFYSSRVLFADNLDPLVSQAPYVRLDGRIILARQDDKWSLSLLARNLTDKRIKTFGTNLPSTPGTYIFEIDRPRSVAVQFRYNL